jgi:hypothetical protein
MSFNGEGNRTYIGVARNLSFAAIVFARLKSRHTVEQYLCYLLSIQYSKRYPLLHLQKNRQTSSNYSTLQVGLKVEI